MLNCVADELLAHVYRGERPHDPAMFYSKTTLIGYGNVSLASQFTPWPCAQASLEPARDPVTWAVPLLLSASRYTVASHLLQLMYQPRNSYRPIRPFVPHPYVLAMHVRRGDKLTERRNSERIQVWDEDQLTAAAAPLIKAKLGSSPSKKPVVLLASDDNKFAAKLEARLRSTLSVEVERLRNDHDKGTAAPGDACDETCIPSLQELADSFAHASSLMISTKSNMGSFLLTWWGASNGGGAPLLVDMDAKVTKGQFQKGKHFCALAWGSRHGMCESNRTTVSRPGTKLVD